MEKLKRAGITFYEGCPRLKTAIVLLVVAVYMGLTVYSGGHLGQHLWFYLAVGLYVVLPGLFLAKVLKTESWMPGYTGPLALLLGAGFFAVLYCFTMRLGVLVVLRVLPLLLSAGFLVWKGRDFAAFLKSGKKWSRPMLSPRQWMLILLFSALLLNYTFTGVVKNALPLEVGNTLLDQDLLWNIGNANSFKLAFPPIDIRYYDVRLSYHYLTELLAGALSLVSGVGAYPILAFYMQPLMLAGMVLCMARLARLLWPESVLKQLLFPYAMFVFSCASLWKVLPNGWSVFWNQNIIHLITNINSQTTACIFLCIFLGLYVAAARKRYCVGVLHMVLTLCAFAMLCVSKGPMAAIVAVALVLSIFIGFVQKKASWQGLVLGLLLLGVFVLFYFVLFSSGANNSTEFSIYKTLEVGYFYNILNRINQMNHTLWYVAVFALYLVQTLLLMPAQIPLFVRGLCHDVRHFGRLSQPRMLFYAAGIGGVLAYFLVYHPHMSQNYFLYTGIFFITLLVVDNIDYLKPVAEAAHPFLRKAGVLVVAFFAAAGLVTTAFLYTNLIGSGARRLATNLGFLEKYPYDVVVTADDEAGMIWLNQNAPQDSMFATNRIHTGAREEGISNLYSALSGRQGYMEGFQYAMTNMGVSVASVEERQYVNGRLFGADTPPEEVERLCGEYEIDYLVYSTQMAGDESQLSQLELVYDSPTLRIYRLPEGAEP